MITTDGTDEQVAQLARETERRCPVSQLFALAGVSITSTWTKA